MTKTVEEYPSGVQEITVRDDEGPLQFMGEPIADVSWSYRAAAANGFNRWTDIILYKVWQESIKFEYAVQIMGKSVVYHDVDGSCHQGIRMTAVVLYQDTERYNALTPCGICKPKSIRSKDVKDSDVFAIEVDLPTLHWCKNADEVIQVLYDKGPGAPGVLSGLSTRLLQGAAPVDKNIEAALLRRRKL